MSDQTTADFTDYYLQRATKEFAEDLDKIRTAGDFKGDALPLLIGSLSQGTSVFPKADQMRVAAAQSSQTPVDRP